MLVKLALMIFGVKQALGAWHPRNSKQNGASLQIFAVLAGAVCGCSRAGGRAGQR